jgi:hypothetical protein
MQLMTIRFFHVSSHKYSKRRLLFIECRAPLDNYSKVLWQNYCFYTLGNATKVTYITN